MYINYFVMDWITSLLLMLCRQIDCIKAPPSAVVLNEPQTVIEEPSGIYVVDSKEGLYRDANISDQAFVQGYAWRFSWKDLETEKGVYDFTPVDHIINTLGERDQKLSWLVLGDIPEYIIREPTVETWLDGAVLKPLPWDLVLRDRYERFVAALAAHKVADPAQDGEMVPLNKHSVLSVIHPGLPGTPRGGLRDTTQKLKDIPGYSRAQLLDETLEPVIEMFSRYFPNQPQYFSLWKIEDDLDSEMPLWAAVLEKISNHAHVGVWQDNLAASRDCAHCEVVQGRPIEVFAEPLLRAHQKNIFTGFQALSSWRKPFAEAHVENVAYGTPMDGLKWANETYGTRYFELYVADVENPAWQEGLAAWDKKLR